MFETYDNITVNMGLQSVSSDIDLGLCNDTYNATVHDWLWEESAEEDLELVD